MRARRCSRDAQYACHARGRHHGTLRRPVCLDEQMAIAQRIFNTVGRTVVVDEKHMDAVTGLSGSGPAFLYIIIEALAEAGVNVGLPRDVATLLAAQTTLGSARMVLETGYHPALLKDAVTTPAGCTVDGILELEEGGLRVTLIKAVKRATSAPRNWPTAKSARGASCFEGTGGTATAYAEEWRLLWFVLPALLRPSPPPASAPIAAPRLRPPSLLIIPSFRCALRPGERISIRSASLDALTEPCPSWAGCWHCPS